MIDGKWNVHLTYGGSAMNLADFLSCKYLIASNFFVASFTSSSLALSTKVPFCLTILGNLDIESYIVNLAEIFHY